MLAPLESYSARGSASSIGLKGVVSVQAQLQPFAS